MPFRRATVPRGREWPLAQRKNADATKRVPPNRRQSPSPRGRGDARLPGFQQSRFVLQSRILLPPARSVWAQHSAPTGAAFSQCRATREATAEYEHSSAANHEHSRVAAPCGGMSNSLDRLAAQGADILFSNTNVCQAPLNTRAYSSLPALSRVAWCQARPCAASTLPAALRSASRHKPSVSCVKYRRPPES